MSKDTANLTQLQVCALIALWTQPPGEVANRHLEKALRVTLEKKPRDGMEKAGLITVRQDRRGGPVFLELTTAGRDRIRDELDTELPKGARCGEAALHAVLSALRPLFDGSAKTLPDLIARSGPRPHDPRPADTDLETRIRHAYGEAAPRAGAWVMLARLREVLGHPDRAQVDAALVQLSRQPDVHLIPESNQKALGEQAAAAVRIGNQDRHLISIGS